jgi:hypothetical protein
MGKTAALFAGDGTDGASPVKNPLKQIEKGKQETAFQHLCKTSEIFHIVLRTFILP